MDSRAVALDLALASVAEALSPTQLDDLARTVAGAGGYAAPGGVGPAGQAAVARLRSAVDGAGGGPGGPNQAGVALALRSLAEQCRKAARSSARAVWTGPEAEGSQRLTASVVRELLLHAEETVLLVSFAVRIVPGIKASLAQAAARGARIDCVFETRADSGGSLSSSDAGNLADIAGTRFWRWPVEQRPEAGAALHAKLICVDRRDVLITSANLTERAFEENLELGVLLKNHPVAADVDDHVRGLMAAGVLTLDTTG